MKKYTLQIVLTSEMLGTNPADPELFQKFIASRREEGDPAVEKNDIPLKEEIERSMTVFREIDNKFCIPAYMIKGFFKAAASAINAIPDGEDDDAFDVEIPKAFKKKINELIFVNSTDAKARDLLVLKKADGTPLAAKDLQICTRPLRAQTAQGERVALSSSYTAPIGTIIEAEITLLTSSLENLVRNLLDYGQFSGLGQWRNAGKGQFTYELKPVK